MNGGFGTCVFPNGFFDFNLGGQVGDPHEPIPGDSECGVGGGHMLNDQAEHSCSLGGQGKVRLKVKMVKMDQCDKQK